MEPYIYDNMGSSENATSVEVIAAATVPYTLSLTNYSGTDTRKVININDGLYYY